MEDPYNVLGVRKDAPQEVVEASYRRLVKEYHPDTGSGDRAKFEEVRNAYERVQELESSETPGQGTQDSNSQPTSEDAEWDGVKMGGHTWGGMPVEESSGSGKPNNVTVDGKYLEAKFTGIERRSISSLTHSHKVANLNDPPLRPVATFEVHNHSGQIIPWRRKQFRFIDSEGYTYGPSEDYMVDERDLGPRWAGINVDLESGARSKYVIILEDIPSDVDIEKIVHTLKVFEPGKTSGWVKEKERYVFEIDELPEISAELPGGE